MRCSRNTIFPTMDELLSKAQFIFYLFCFRMGIGITVGLYQATGFAGGYEEIQDCRASWAHVCRNTQIQIIGIPPPLIGRAQMIKWSSAPDLFSTPFCENRYQKTAILAERCYYFQRKNPTTDILREGNTKISLIHKIPSAFLCRIRGPPFQIAPKICNNQEDHYVE